MVLANCSSGFKHSVHEVMGDGALVSKIGSTKVFQELEVLNKFFLTLDKDTMKVA